MKCPECKSIRIKTDAVYGNKHFFQCKDCKALFQVCSGTPTLPHLNKNGGVSRNKKRGRKPKMTKFKYLGKKSEDFIEKILEEFVEDHLHEHCRKKMKEGQNEILKEMFERSKEVFKEKVF